MPQLNPTPWLYTLLISWLIFLTIVLPKTLNYVFTNEPTMQDTEKTKQNPWFWPWF